MSDQLNILEALHDQVERLELRDVMSPAERQLQNAILVILDVLIDDRRARIKREETR